MKIKIGNFEVYSTGTVIGVLNEPITFFIEDLVFEIQFIDDKENKERKFYSEIPPEEKKMILYFKNFNNTLGAGNIKPIKVGVLADKDIYLNFRLYAGEDQAAKTFHYTWLTKEKKGGNDE